MQNSSWSFEVHPQSGVPIFRQLVEQVRRLILSGKLAAGELLPSVRQLASDLQINMMTVSKAYSLLEAEGIVERVRGTGMRVVELKPTTVAQRQAELRPSVEDLVTRARQLNLTDEQLQSLLKAVLKSNPNPS
ncbi:MAG: GntR family transcriptional regulator [Planctomycetaceae bacterium]|nr:GntR family transcriptional regulator [Planctomycetaceae bacterium]